MLKSEKNVSESALTPPPLSKHPGAAPVCITWMNENLLYCLWNLSQIASNTKMPNYLKYLKKFITSLQKSENYSFTFIICTANV